MSSNTLPDVSSRSINDSSTREVSTTRQPNQFSNFPSGHIMHEIGSYSAQKTAVEVSPTPNVASSPKQTPIIRSYAWPPPLESERIATLISKAQVAQNSHIVSTRSPGAKRSARLKSSHHKPLLSAGKNPSSRLEQKRAELAEKKAAEAEKAKKLEEEKEKERNVRVTAKALFVQLLEALPREAFALLPGDFQELKDAEKMKVLCKVHVRFREENGGGESGRVLGEVEDDEEEEEEEEEEESTLGCEEDEEEQFTKEECENGAGEGQGEYDGPRVIVVVDYDISVLTPWAEYQIHMLRLAAVTGPGAPAHQVLEQIS
ncbi:hypothetical protein BU23DRAFT_664356 [Bimuria novae-zelandiae CBS 107.79]|uniref:Uncharacterized protein n=1 Tax=Bimuria novae-zelandiae CBS 107.79 TaxID=1447943 RepID=A0A6A5UMI6_9PLEO|nr:hypothetical protein BU23DRAFT_664356 [Bimuria novae-zelandiae CBS 107.79]